MKFNQDSFIQKEEVKDSLDRYSSEKRQTFNKIIDIELLEDDNFKTKIKIDELI